SWKRLNPSLITRGFGMLRFPLSRHPSSRIGLPVFCFLGILGLAVCLSRGSDASFGNYVTQQPSESVRSAIKVRSLNSVPGEILVRFRSGAPAREIKTRSEISVEENGRRIPIQLETLFAGPEIVEGLRFARVAPEDTSAAIKALSARPEVLYAE